MIEDPKTKEQFVDRILSYDFNGDFAELGAEPAKIARESAYSFSLKFPDSGQKYLIVVRKPRRAKPKLRVVNKPKRPVRAQRRPRRYAEA